MSIESMMMPSNHLILCRPLLLLPSVFPRIRVFSNESVLHTRWPKDWNLSFSVSPSNEYSGLWRFHVHLKIICDLSWFIWRRKWQHTPVFLPGKSHGRRGLVGLQSMGSQRVGHNWATSFTHSLTWWYGMFYSSQLDSTWLIVFLSSYLLSFLIFYLLVLSIHGRKILMSPTKIIDLSAFSFNVINFCAYILSPVIWCAAI